MALTRATRETVDDSGLSLLNHCMECIVLIYPTTDSGLSYTCRPVVGLGLRLAAAVAKVDSPEGIEG